MTLPTLLKAFGLIHIVMGLAFGIPTWMVSDMMDWEHSVGIATMSEHWGSTLIIVGLFFFQMPSLLGDRLHEFTKLALIAQIILLAMPLYHAAIGAIPMDAMWYLLVIISAGFLYFTYALDTDASAFRRTVYWQCCDIFLYRSYSCHIALCDILRCLANFVCKSI